MIFANPAYRPIVTTERPIVIVTGGRGSGKSHDINAIGCLITYEKGHKIMVLRYTMKSAKESVIPEFKEKLEKMKVSTHFKVLQSEAKNIHTNVEVLFRGVKTSSGNQTAKLKSIQGLTTLICEEFEEFTNQEEFETILNSVRTKGVRNIAILIMNPPTINHWVWEEYFKNHLSFMEIDGCQIETTNHPEVCHIHTTYLDNIHNLSESFINRIKRLRETNREKYDRIFLGKWGRINQGVCFKNWIEGEFDESLPHCYGMDLGFFPDPLAFIKVAVDIRAKKIYAKEFIYELELSTKKVVNLVGEVVSKRDLIVADTNEPRLLHALKWEIRDRGGREVKKARFNVIKATKGPKSVINDYRDLQDWQFIIDPYSYNVKREFNSHVWNDKKASIPVGENDHSIAAIRYAWRKLIKGRKSRVGYRN